MMDVDSTRTGTVKTEAPGGRFLEIFAMLPWGCWLVHLLETFEYNIRWRRCYQRFQKLLLYKSYIFVYRLTNFLEKFNKSNGDIQIPGSDRKNLDDVTQKKIFAKLASVGSENIGSTVAKIRKEHIKVYITGSYKKALCIAIGFSLWYKRKGDVRMGAG